MVKTETWRDPNHYLDLLGHDAALWAWQFLRRNPDYQRDWRAFNATWQELEAVYGKPPHRDFNRWKQDPRAYAQDNCAPNTDGFGCAGEGGKLLLECWMGQKWGFYKFPLDPAYRTPQVPDELLWREIDIEVPLYEPHEIAQLNDAPGLCLAELDLSLPLKPQLEKLRQTLIARQHGLRQQGILKMQSVQNQQPHWIQCLRLLDALAEGSSLKEVGSVFKAETPNLDIDVLHQQAQSLLRNYRRILLLH